MKKIFVATDFSNSAKNAGEYALSLAKYFDASIELVHAFDVPFTFSDSGMQYIDIEEIEKGTREALDREVERLHQIDRNVLISSQSCVGRIIDCLNDMSKKNEPLLIVFGMSGENESFLWGSTAVAALRSFDSPVLIVPKTAKWSKVEEICYAVNYKKVRETTPYELVVKWVQLFSARLTVFNVHDVDEPLEPPAKLKSSLQEMSPEYVSLESNNFETGIQDFLSQHKFDWVIVIPQKHGFFDRLTHSSRSRQIAKISSVPVLSFYEK